MKEITAEEALSLIEGTSPRGEILSVELHTPGIGGMVLAEDISADRDIPPYNRAMVDGYAVNSRDLLEKQITDFEIKDTLRAGSDDRPEIDSGQALFIMTGAPVPEGLDMIVKRETVHVENGTVHIPLEKAKAWFNIARRGEDARQDDLLLPAGATVDPGSIQILSAMGRTSFRVIRRPTVALITTGDEVVPPDFWPEEWQIRDSSAAALRFLLQGAGMDLSQHDYVKDDSESLTNAIESGLRHDVLLITGGVSMGVTDVIPSLLEKHRVKPIFHRLLIKPGRPLYFGSSGANRAVFGLPGNPVSSQVTLRQFVFPWIRAYMGLPPERPLRLPLCSDREKAHELQEYAHVVLQEKGGASCLEPVVHHGSGDYAALRGTAGLMIHPAGREKLSAGEVVAFYPWSSNQFIR